MPFLCIETFNGREIVSVRTEGKPRATDRYRNVRMVPINDADAILALDLLGRLYADSIRPRPATDATQRTAEAVKKRLCELATDTARAIYKKLFNEEMPA